MYIWPKRRLSRRLGFFCRRWPLWACVGPRWACGGLRWPAVVFGGLCASAVACVGLRWPAVSFVGLCGPALVLVGRRWPSLAFVGLRWAFVGLRAFVVVVN